MKTVLTLLKNIAVILAGFLFFAAPGLLKLLYFGVVIFVGYRSLLIGWLMLIPPCLFVTWVWGGHMLEKPPENPKLSPEANKLLRKCYPHYSLPNTFSTYAHIAILSWMSALVLAAFGCFRGSWWGVPFAIAA